MLKKFSFFGLLIFVFLIAGCYEGSPNNTRALKNPIRIIYPQNSAKINLENIPVVVSVENLLTEPSVYIDSQKAKYKLQQITPHIYVYFLKIPEGKHTITITAYAPKDISKPYGKNNKKLYQQSVSVIVSHKGTIRFVPLNNFQNFSYVHQQKNFPVYKVIPQTSDLIASTGKESILVRVKKGHSSLYWLLPANNPEKARILFYEKPPLLKIAHGENNIFFVSKPVLCYSKSDTYLIPDYQKNKKGEYEFIYHILSTKKPPKVIKISEKHIIKKIFNEKLQPWPYNYKALKNYSLALLPFVNSPIMCSDQVVSQEIILNCLWIKCKPNTKAYHLAVNKDGSFKVLLSKNKTKDGYTWEGEEILIPLQNKLILINLNDGLYTDLKTGKKYPLPFKNNLPSRTVYYFEENTLKSAISPESVEIKDSPFYTLNELYIGNRIIIRTNLFFKKSENRYTLREEVPINYEIQPAD